MLTLVYKYMISGILDAKILEDGGPECYNQIPKDYHITSALLSIAIHIIIFGYWFKHLIGSRQSKHPVSAPNRLEILVAINCIISLALTFYFKLATKKGAFILNPCHFCLLLQFLLLLGPNSDKMKKLHTIWTAFLFGAAMALGLPHLYGITPFEVYLYYYEHILILPVGPLILYRRYGFAAPTFKNQMASFSVVVVYQMVVLLPVCLATTVNLNFALCHSPADPFQPYVGHHYFTGGVVFLNLCSYVVRWLCCGLVLPCKLLYKPQDEQKQAEKQPPKKSVKRQ